MGSPAFPTIFPLLSRVTSLQFLQVFEQEGAVIKNRTKQTAKIIFFFMMILLHVKYTKLFEFGLIYKINNSFDVKVAYKIKKYQLNDFQMQQIVKIQVLQSGMKIFINCIKN